MDNRADRLEAAIAVAVEAATNGSDADTIVRAALRVAVLRQDYLAEYWLGLELAGIRTPQSGSRTEVSRARLEVLVGAEEATRQRAEVFALLMARRRVSESDDSVNATPVSDLQAQLALTQGVYDSPIASGMSDYETAKAFHDLTGSQTKLMPNLLMLRGMLERIKDAAYSYVLEVEANLLLGQAVPDAVAQGQAFVQERLSLIAPDAWTALQSAEERLANGESESLSQAATSIRRSMKLLADALFPPTAPVVDADGVTRVLDDERWKNRLTEFVRLRIGHSKHAEVIASSITGFSSRLNALDRLASKGVHDAPTRTEVESAVAWTYMLAADLLRVDDSSGSDGTLA